MNDNITITYPLSRLLHLLIGDNHYVHVPSDFAEIVLALTKNDPNMGFFTQTDSGPDETLVSPRVWIYRYWVSTSAQWERRRKWSEHERNMRFVKEANLKRVAQAIADETDMPLEIARISAYKLLARKNSMQAVKALGVSKLYNDIKELP